MITSPDRVPGVGASIHAANPGAWVFLRSQPKTAVPIIASVNKELRNRRIAAATVAETDGVPESLPIQRHPAAVAPIPSQRLASTLLKPLHMPAPSTALEIESVSVPVHLSTQDELLFVQILQFLLDARHADDVAHRATIAVGLLPEVAGARVGASATDPPDFTFALGDTPLALYWTNPTMRPQGGARVQQILRLVRRIHEREQTLEKLAMDAHTDALTGLYNRRGFEPLVDLALARAHRSGEEIALILVDIDHFKHINDSYGHDVGDRTICLVADAIQTVIRPTDAAARIGGDEMAILLAGANVNGATQVAKRLQHTLRDANRLTSTTPTLSIGIAEPQYVERAIDANQARASLFRAADEALYEAKRRGRDRIHCHEYACALQPIFDRETTQPINVEAADSVDSLPVAEDPSARDRSRPRCQGFHPEGLGATKALDRARMDRR